MERRETRQTNRSKLVPQPPSEGAFKGYTGIDRISLAARRLKPEEKMTNLVYHINEFNLCEAFRRCDGNKACGIDQVTKKHYRQELQDNITKLHDEIYRGGWRPKPSRQVMIPKANGGYRPLAIGCLEDKIFQTLLAKILEGVFDPIFYRHSYGFRSGKNQHQAIARAYQEIDRRRNSCSVVEMDIEKFFDSINHDKLMELIEQRIGDQAILRLIRRSLRNSILTVDGLEQEAEMGTPQGSPISPILSNIYLHYVLDDWFEKNWQSKGEMVRFADDAIFVFSDEKVAEDFRESLKSRLESFDLKLNLEKSGIRQFDRRSKTGDIPFLGFAFYWGKTWSRKTYLKVKTLPRKLAAAIQNFKEWIKTNRHRKKLDALWIIAKAKIIGHYNYYGVTTNFAKLNHYYYACINLLFRWLNRRSQKRSFTWEQFERRLMFKSIPSPNKGSLVIDITNGLGSKLKRKPKSRMRKLRTYGSVRSGGKQLPLFT